MERRKTDHRIYELTVLEVFAAVKCTMNLNIQTSILQLMVKFIALREKYLVVGGAHSVDKMLCLEENKPFWKDKMADDIIKERVEESLVVENYKIYGMMTHTCPIEYIPTEMFMSTHQNAAIKRKPRKAKSKKMFKDENINISKLLVALCAALTTTPGLSTACELNYIVSEDVIVGYER